MIRSRIGNYSSIFSQCKTWLNASNLRTQEISTTSVKLADDINKSVKLNEPAVIDTDQFLKEDKIKGYITIDKEPNLASINGAPEEHVRERRVRIYQPAKNAMQSGTSNIGHWQTEFDTKDRWENPLMGWTSTGDPLSNLKNEFRTKEEAIAFCEKSGFKYYIAESKTSKPERVKNYGVNFAWNKRTRVSTK
ncbi:NADH dehydrogenase [ubiquinone] iron-sulfur protein 4, mitochondrial [Chrysoperla carnea]|uniref:NADH dehydrogenase [ubiquinone] iron-sulfur protein 4, mitochondrial n=1 Tax=Chrysoperla carnea TaxID=189513 RepID=UPI001D0997AC|nr:NADH dehydrogenase [ubiquinone] iron-sulfur protein 4, mitochondrial [Chrysoperla carnea]